MNVLVGCEESQEVCKAFRRLGHNAFSCDLLKSSGGHPEWHYMEDVFKVAAFYPWDIGIFFPPCTDIATSGARWFPEKRADGRQQKAVDFFIRLALLPIPKIAIENPVGVMSTFFRKPDQIVQPWMFGDPFTKTTCLWLKRLQKLQPTGIVEKGERILQKSGNLSYPGWMAIAPGDNRSKLRSKTFQGLAAAMAMQWGGDLH